MTHWLVEALERGLRDTPSDFLQEEAARHILLKDETRTEAGGHVKRISPTLLANECRLARLKRYRGHGGQPGDKRRNLRQGRPSATSTIHFTRGYLGEGMMTAALRAVSVEGPAHSSFYPDFQIIGVSPVMKFEATVMVAVGDGTQVNPPTANFLAYPDVVIIREGELELVQLKCPSVFAIGRYRRDSSDLRRRYEPQAIAEMFIGRRMGLPVVRNHILAYSFEGFTPGSSEAREGLEVNAVVETVDWNEDGMPRWVLSQAEEILEDDRNADAGRWVPAYPAETANKWPCSYCAHPRVSEAELVGCEENERWESAIPIPPPPPAVIRSLPLPRQPARP